MYILFYIAKLIIHALSSLKSMKLSLVKDFLVSLASLLTTEKATIEQIKSTYLKVSGKELDSVTYPDTLVNSIKEFTVNFGISNDGALFFNGKYIPLDQSYQQQFIGFCPIIESYIRTLLQTGKIGLSDNIYKIFLDKGYDTKSSVIFSTPQFVDVLNSPKVGYISDSRESIVSAIVIADFDSEIGLKLAIEFLRYLVVNNNTRVLFLSSTRSNHVIPKLAFSKLDLKSLDFDNIDFSTIKIDWVTDSILDTIESGRKWVVEELNVVPGSNHVIVNGRKVGPFDISSVTAVNIKSLIKLELDSRISGLVDILDGVLNESSEQYDSIHLITALVNSAKAAYPIKRKSMDFLGKWDGEYTSSGPSNNLIQIVLIVDPISNDAQKFSTVLKVLRENPIVSTILYLNPDPEMTKIPVNRFYRFLISPKLVYENNELVQPRVVFTRIPQEPLLTLGMDGI